ncbi:MAG TPA: hypothetical protein VFX97_16820 [Pyrinomonadaceae bacterium]|nr:hypothetical protein [Pyrinomonadaceae bacterium]
MPDPKPETTSEETDKTPEGKDKAGTQPKSEDALKFTQADLDRVAAKTREEEKEKARKAKEKEDAARAEAEAKEQGKFQQLAEARQKELDEITPKLEAAEAELKELKPAFAALIDAELKTLPEDVVEAGPAKFDDSKTLTNPLDVAAWLPNGKKLAEKLNGQSAKPGAKIDPKEIGAPGNEAADRQARAQARRAYRD